MINVAPEMEVGIIGMGEMGRMYAGRLSAAKNCRINVCDREENFDKLYQDYKDNERVNVMKNGHFVSRQSDFIMYAVEAAYIDNVVKEFGPSTKVGAIVAGQTSVKAPEREAFEKYLPEDVHIVSIHSLHAPSVDTVGQALIIIQHRAPDEKVQIVKELLAPLRSRYVDLTYEEHDIITANTQAVTHIAFMTMGTAWKSSARFPWETTRYVGGLEVVKINITLRIFSAKWHVYAGLAILNPNARVQINQFAQSSTDLFKLMISEDSEGLRKRVYEARDYIFGSSSSKKPLFVSDEVFNKFGINEVSETNEEDAPRNSHLAILAIVDCWHQLKVRPFQHLEVAATPLFRLWFGVAEYLFRNQERLDAALDAAITEQRFRSDDAEFCIAANGWSQCIELGSFDWYSKRFEDVRSFFEPRFEECRVRTNQMLKEILTEDKK